MVLLNGSPKNPYGAWSYSVRDPSGAPDTEKCRACLGFFLYRWRYREESKAGASEGERGGVAGEPSKARPVTDSSRGHPYFGSVTVTVVPLPSSESSAIVPPWSSMMCLAV